MNMREPTTAWDRAPTGKELISFYGDIPTVFEVNTAIERHTSAIDKDDLTEICHEFEAEALAAIRGKDAAALLALFTSEINKTIASRASFAVYGDTGVIPVSMVAA
jgi:hypothetical protein